MLYLVRAVAVFVFVPAALACNFKYNPAATQQYYRAEGWKLPGTTDFNPRATPRTYGAPMRGPIPGGRASLLSHDEDPYIVEFPAEDFVLNGARKRMRSAQMKATIIRWDVNGHLVAYSYGLIPVKAHRESGEWKVETEMACIFYATFIDNKGDGIFRVLVPDAFTADLVPLWAQRKEN
jgi:hypothetical protein